MPTSLCSLAQPRRADLRTRPVAFACPAAPGPSTERLPAVAFTPTSPDRRRCSACELAWLPGTHESSRPFRTPAFGAPRAEVRSGPSGLCRAVLVYTLRSSRIDPTWSDTRPRPRRPLAGARHSTRLHAGTPPRPACFVYSGESDAGHQYSFRTPQAILRCRQHPDPTAA